MRKARCKAYAGLLAAVVVAAQVHAQPAATGSRFRLADVVLDGGQVRPGVDWPALVAPLRGREIDFAELETLRAAIERRHHDQGWRLASVRIPAQATDTGVIRMVLVDPRLGQVRIAGVAPADSARWRALLPALREGEPPNITRLDRQLALANESPARRVQVAFVPGATPDTLDAEVRVEQAVPSGWVAFLDNTGDDATGKLRHGLAWRHADLWGLGHQLNVQVISAPHDPDHPSRFTPWPSRRVQIYGLGYRVPVVAAGAWLEATLGHSNVDSGTVQDLFTVRGRGSTASLRGTVLMDRQGGWEPRWFLAADWRHYDSQTLYGGVNLAVPLTLRPLTVGFSVSRPAVPQAPTAASAWVSFSANLPGGQHGGDAAFAASRAGATPRYQVLRFGGSALREVADWRLSATVDGQWSDDLLVSGEQFSAGGAGSVRGFADRGITGDTGLRLQVEAVTPNLWPASGDGAGAAATVRLAAFVDAASARRRAPAALELARTAIASVGVGLRAQWGPATLRLDLARPVHQRTGGPRESGAAHVSAAFAF
ncbi:ShlB/FhaC/HecB family hemolysin secretion/activation protein [Ramlibacter sp.]|uniref:ShlB/FhaC/HecB family hemolysin secretion/activation protein n=1 Tax=Ramlibacter sp. TaxID=1917967 RepID=UPI0035B095B2